jgi:hypothetical protein
VDSTGTAAAAAAFAGSCQPSDPSLQLLPLPWLLLQPKVAGSRTSLLSCTTAAAAVATAVVPLLLAVQLPLLLLQQLSVAGSVSLLLSCASPAVATAVVPLMFAVQPPPPLLLLQLSVAGSVSLLLSCAATSSIDALSCAILSMRSCKTTTAQFNQSQSIHVFLAYPYPLARQNSLLSAITFSDSANR